MNDLMYMPCEGYLLFGYVTHGGLNSDQKTRNRLKSLLATNNFVMEFRGMYISPVFNLELIERKKAAIKGIENVKDIEMWFAYTAKEDFMNYFEIYKKDAVA